MFTQGLKDDCLFQDFTLLDLQVKTVLEDLNGTDGGSDKIHNQEILNLQKEVSKLSLLIKKRD